MESGQTMGTKECGRLSGNKGSKLRGKKGIKDIKKRKREKTKLVC